MFTIALVAALLLTGFGGVGVAAAYGPDYNNNPGHPACMGDKYKISSEGTDVGDKDGKFTGSKWFIKPVCSGVQGKPVFNHHEPDNVLSVPESLVLGCHENARDVSPNFVEDSCEE